MKRQNKLCQLALPGRRARSCKRFGSALAGILWLFIVLAQIAPATDAFGQDYILTMVVLINAQNSTGYNPSQQNPGEFQRFTERYLEHLQVPYEVFDVATEPPPNLLNRQLILSGHRGLNLSSAWRSAITNAVNAGVGFVNLDSSSTVGQQSHIQAIFGATGSSLGTPNAFVTIQEEVLQDGASPHFIAALQRRFLGDPAGDIVYSFHRDAAGALQTVTSTVLTGASGTVIASVGADPLVLARTFGLGRAVHFGTLDYLRADRFGFLRGLDDLFWRSLVWAARKPFVVRGFPRFWAVQMDDTLGGWIFRVRDLYNTTLTGGRASDGTGGPWRVTGYTFTESLPPGNGERAAMIEDINAGNLQISPHSRGGDYGTLYWQAPSGQQHNDASWLLTLSDIEAWMTGTGGADEIPFLSRSMVPHFWNLSNITGSDLWNRLGFRYITEIQRPGIDFYAKTQADRLRLRPFRLHEIPPSNSPDENHPIYIADDYTVNSSTGLPPQTFFNFTTQIIDLARYDRQDVAWPNNDRPVQESVDQFQYYSWRLWSSLAPVQIYTHDGSSNMILASDAQRQEVVRQVSAWLNERGVRHVFMEDLGDYMYARTNSVLTGAESSNGNVTLTFSGDAATPDNDRLTTEVLAFSGDSEGVPISVPGFTSGSTITLPLPSGGNPAPTIASINPTSAEVGGPAFTLTVNGSGFVSDSVVRWDGVDRPTTFVSSTRLEAGISASDIDEGGTVAVTVFNPAPGGGTSNSQTFSITIVPSNSFGDNFNRPNNGVLGNGWIEKTAAAFSLASNQVSKAATGSGFRDNLVYRPAAENLLDVEASVELRFTSLPPGYPQVFVRGQTATIANAGVFSGYLLFVDNDIGRAFLSRMENGAFNTVAQLNLNPLLNTVDTFRLRLRATGTNPVALEAYVERLSGTTWTVIGQALYNDTAATRFATAGTVGFSGHTEGGVYTYDNFTRLTFGGGSGNPVPAISGLVPDSATAGGGAFTLTVNGNGFVADSVVRWNGANRTTTFSSATQLQAAISATDIAAAGSAAVTVLNPAPGGGTSNAQNFAILAAPSGPFVDDFNRADNAALGNSWIEKTAAAFALAGNRVSKAATSSIFSNNLVYRPTAENLLDVEASVEVRFTSLPPGYPQVFVRGQTATIANAGVFDGYLLFIDNASNRALLDRVQGGAFFQLVQITINPALNTTDTFRLRLRATGTDPVALEAYVERLSGATWTVIGQALFNDTAASRFATAGTVGFSGHVEGGAYTFDNFTRLSLDSSGSGNPVPVMTGTAPTSAQEAGSGFTLTVNGSGFVADSVVRWNGANRTTTLISATQLQATIPAADIAAAGTAAVTVLNPAPGGGASNALSFFILESGGAFFSENFNRPDNSNIGNGWTEKFPNAFSIQSTEVVSIDTAPIDYHDTIVYRPTSEDRRDVEVGIEFRVGAGQNFPQVHARVQRNTIAQADTLESYIFFVDGFEPSPGRAIIAVQPPVTDQFECYMVAIPFPSPLQSSERYRLRFRVTGTAPVALTGFVDRLNGGTWQVFASGAINHDASTQRDPNLYCAQQTMPPPITTTGAVGFAKWTTNSEVLDNFYWMDF